jgi:hypothetical protein
MLFNRKAKKQARQIAIWAAEAKFTGTCGRHGETQFDTWGGHCEACYAEYEGKEPSFVALVTRPILYRDVCPVHGEHDFSGDSRKCLACHDKLGRLRPPGFDYATWAAKELRPAPKPKSNPQRAEARRQGHASYAAECDVHGMTEHNVVHGKCLTCHTTSGALRSVRQHNPGRAEARARGEASYLEWCDVHGAGDHSVANGKCLTCFTTAGARRKTMRVAD